MAWARLLIAMGCAAWLAVGCTSDPLGHSVLVVDACSAAPSPQPLNLRQAAQAAGCAYAATGLSPVQLTVEAVVSPREFIVRSQYGAERVRPLLEAATIDRLQYLGGRDDELSDRLERALAGKQLLEPASFLGPAATSAGLRVVRLFTLDDEPLDELVCAEIDRLPNGASPSVSPAGLDLARVTINAASLQTHVAAAVAAAEQWSSFRAPPGLSVRWMTPGDLPVGSSSVYDAWRAQVGPCFRDDGGPEEIAEADWAASSIPGGTIFVRPDRDWRELELHWVLLHELMHQHQYALCAGGLPLRDVPDILRQAHASLLACDILRLEGASADALDFAREFDPYAAATQTLDAMRSRLGITPDECLRRLADDADLARRLVPGLGDDCACADADAPAIRFECAPRQQGHAVVTIINERDEPFAGCSNGWWCTRTSTARGERTTGGAPFAVRLPPRGRVTVETAVNLTAETEVVACWTRLSRTPSPVFDLPASTEQAGTR